MRSSDIDPLEMIDLLASSKCTKPEAQKFFQAKYKVRVPRTNYDLMWERLAEQLGDLEAARAVFDLVLKKASPRLIKVLDQAETRGTASLRISDPRIVELLFYEGGQPNNLGAFLLDYRIRSRVPVPRAPTAVQPPPAGSPALPTHVQLSELIERSPRAVELSAAPGSGWRLEQVRASAGTFLKADPKWLERDLEEFIVSNWSGIDFGLGQPLYLIGRQVRLKNTREKVDLLAKTADGTWTAIELKIVQATGADLTQLISYLQDLAFAGIPHERMRGLLVAPSFAEKVLNAAGSDSRIVLLRFLMEE